MPFAFLMNLDGASEFPAGTGRDPFLALERRPHLLSSLRQIATQEGRILCRGERLPGFTGVAFVPTRHALECLAQADTLVASTPAQNVLETVNHRGFATALAPIEGGHLFDDVDRALGHVRLLCRQSAAGARLKRPFAFAGRGHLQIQEPDLRQADQFVRTSVTREGSVLVEPEFYVVAEFAIHGYLPRSGSPTFGAPTVQLVGKAGSWQATALAKPTDLTESERECLERSIVAAAQELGRARYFGPFGIDAFRYVHDGQLRFRAISDLNARYSMGYAVGMGLARPDLVS